METNNKLTNMTLMEKYLMLESLLHRYRYFGRKQHGRGADPHRGQGRVLALLKLQPEISQKDLGYLLGMRNQSLGELLSKLERCEYVTRTPSERDRRVMMVQLTEAGKAAAEQMEAEQRNFESPFDLLSEEEKKSLSEILDRMIDALEEKMGEAEDMDDPRMGRHPGFDPRRCGPDWEGRGHGRGGDFHGRGRGPWGPGQWQGGCDHEGGRPDFAWPCGPEEDEA